MDYLLAAIRHQNRNPYSPRCKTICVCVEPGFIEALWRYFMWEKPHAR